MCVWFYFLIILNMAVTKFAKRRKKTKLWEPRPQFLDHCQVTIKFRAASLLMYCHCAPFSDTGLCHCLSCSQRAAAAPTLSNIPSVAFRPFFPVSRSQTKTTKSSLFSTFHNFPLSNQTFPKPSRCQTLPQAKRLLFQPVCLQLAQASTIKRSN